MANAKNAQNIMEKKANYLIVRGICMRGNRQFIDTICNLITIPAIKK